MRDTADSRDVFPLAELISSVRGSVEAPHNFTYISSIISIAGDMICPTTVNECLNSLLGANEELENSDAT